MNGRENGNYCSIMGLFWDTGKEHGNDYSIIGYTRFILRIQANLEGSLVP